MGDELVDKREDAWVAAGQVLEVSTPELNALRYALMLDLQLFQRDHGIKRKGAPPEPTEALPEPTVVDGYLDALNDAYTFMLENGQEATGHRLRDALRGRASGTAKRATNSMVDALHDAAVRAPTRCASEKHWANWRKESSYAAKTPEHREKDVALLRDAIEATCQRLIGETLAHVRQRAPVPKDATAPKSERALALEEVAALLRVRADERWAKGKKDEATELHFVASQVEELGKAEELRGAP